VIADEYTSESEMAYARRWVRTHWIRYQESGQQAPSTTWNRAAPNESSGMMEPGPRVHLFSRGGINGLSSRLCLAVSPSKVPPSGEAPTVSGICHWRLDAVAKVLDFVLV
jgi:hypothetical protein